MTTDFLLQDVRRLQAMGLEPFPCAADKRPRVRWQDAPPDGGWTWQEGDLIGLPLPPNTVAVDIDDLEAVRATDLVFPLTDSRQGTRSGGMHLFYRTDGRPVPQVVRRGGIPLDTRVGGKPAKGYIIAWQPDNIHDPSHWAMAPEWVYEAPVIARSVTSPDAPMGTRWDILSFLGKLASKVKMTEAEYLGILTAAKAEGRIVSLDPKRPWTDKDLRVLASEAAAWEPVREGHLDLGEGKAPPPPTPGKPVSVSDYARTVPDDIPWLVENFVYEGAVTLLSGRPKGGKSTLMAQLQRARQHGGMFLGQVVVPGPSLLVTEEGGVAVLHKVGGIGNLDIYDRSMAGDEDFNATLNKVVEWVREQEQTPIVFLDTLAVWAGIEDENSASEMTQALAKVLRLAQGTGCGVVVVHHTRKSGGQHGDAIRGSGAILATVDLSMELRWTQQEDSDDRYLDISGRVIFPDTWRLGFDRATHLYRRLTEEEMAKEKAETSAQRTVSKVQDALDMMPRGAPGWTAAQCEEYVGLTRSALDRLATIGVVHKEGGSKGRGAAARYWNIQVPAAPPPRADLDGDDER